MENCPRCNGTGQIILRVPCWQCTGRGWVDADPHRNAPDPIPCLACAGEGERERQTPCPDCRGTGQLPVNSMPYPGGK